MPYADPEKRKEADRLKKAKKRAAAKAEETEKQEKKGNVAVADVRARAWTFTGARSSACARISCCLAT